MPASCSISERNVEWNQIPKDSYVELIGKEGTQCYQAYFTIGSPEHCCFERAVVFWGSIDALEAQAFLNKQVEKSRRRKSPTLREKIGIQALQAYNERIGDKISDGAALYLYRKFPKK